MGIKFNSAFRFPFSYSPFRRQFRNKYAKIVENEDSPPPPQEMAKPECNSLNTGRISKEAIQFMQSGGARRIEGRDDVISFKDPICGDWRLLILARPLKPKAALITIKVNDVHYMVVVLEYQDGGCFLDCAIYSSRNRQWSYRDPIDVGPRTVDLENPVVSYAGHVIYLASDCEPNPAHRPYIVSYDLDDRTSTFLPLPDAAADAQYEYAISKRGEIILFLIRYCSSTQMFSIWGLVDDKWVEVNESWLGSTDWPGRLECFTFTNRSIVIAMQDGKIYEYEHKTGSLQALLDHEDC